MKCNNACPSFYASAFSMSKSSCTNHAAKFKAYSALTLLIYPSVIPSYYIEIIRYKVSQLPLKNVFLYIKRQRLPARLNSLIDISLFPSATDIEGRTTMIIMM